MILLSEKTGILIQDNHFEIYFGNKNFSQIIEASQDPSLCFLHQVHGDKCVEATQKEKPQADAHWTKDKTKSLLIKTADCLPILVTSIQENWITAIHAGWRGVEQKITTASLKPLVKKDDRTIKVYIGPHIQKKSFEVDKDIAERILLAHNIPLKMALSTSLCTQKESKYFINLSALVIQELHHLGIHQAQVHVSDIDTKTNPDHYSYRRGDTGVRNYSLVRFR